MPLVEPAGAYAVPRSAAPVDLHLDGNEGSRPAHELLAEVADADVEILRRYPHRDRLEAVLARRLEVAPEQVLVTNGGDEAIDSVCRAYLGPGRRIVVPFPGFSMIEHYARVAGGTVERVLWEPGPFPLEPFLARLDDTVGVATVVTPNNPTGGVATLDALRTISEAAPGAVLLVDLAYVEFADTDPTAAILELDNAVVVRTLSKAWGLAGLRVGYAVGPPDIVAAMRAAGGPYPVAGLSLAIAEARVTRDEVAVDAFVERVRAERKQLSDALETHGHRPLPSQGNFVLAEVGGGARFRDLMAGMGIGVRAFPGHEHLDDHVRITCPGDADDFERLEHAIATVSAPDALLFDLDGVLADVSGSYREAIVSTCDSYGVDVTAADVSRAKEEPNSNNDWHVTRRLLARAGVDAPLDEVTRRFGRFYQGDDTHDGLWRTETLLVRRDRLEALSARYRLGIVTGRPRRDAERFLAHHGVADRFEAVVCMEDAPLKPDPAPVRLALQRLGVETAWFVGDTRDDVAAARAAGVMPIGCVAPGEDRATVRPVLVAAGAGVVVVGRRRRRRPHRSRGAAAMSRNNDDSASVGGSASPPSRSAKIERKTRETDIRVVLDLDGTGTSDVSTGLGFLDHMLVSLSRHARFDLELECHGDLEVDDHHTVEDCALTLGTAIHDALGARRGITRFGHAYAPLDEALARAVVDLSGRPYHVVDLGLSRDQIGDVASENLVHFLQSLTITARAALHVDVLRGDNDHHRVEAAFKATALALRAAVRLDGFEGVPSTKGVL